ncbi:hypothetical protein [Streptomyces colonosanans]|uniref:GerMN domain-containing protein n=1 Tax=Streptomyces colonosanans TaxID=1428652 RepID=A0A1S2PMM8_9ACTN|nr:hypothetical protein [Streptomyces colonosanans]OIJ94872.1 hypothetical protein BIV24_10175 [Streptomyces colonosanans]
MTRPDRLRLLRSALLVPVVLALYGCGVPATGVIDAGEPATGVIRPGGTTPHAPLAPTMLYFLAPDGGLAPSVRNVASVFAPAVPSMAATAVPSMAATAVPSTAATADPSAGNDAGLGTVLLVLAKGPTPLERNKGVTSEVPLLKALPRVQSRPGSVTVELPQGTPHLSGKAAEQVICTVAVARRTAAPGGAPGRVTVLGGAGERFEGAGTTCPGY